MASLVLASPALDIPAWEKNARELLKTISPSGQHAVQLAEATKKFDDSSYQAALAEFYDKYVWRHPQQPDLDSMMSSMNEALYNYMEGPSEFTLTGTLKDYDVTPFLKHIGTPVLYTVGEFDEANSTIVRNFASMTPGARCVVLQGAAHMSPWDARDQSVHIVREFLRSADSVAAVTKL